MTPFKNTIIHADCIKALPMLPRNSIDLVITDPPYVRNYVGWDGRAVRNDDNFAWLKPAFAELYRVLRDDTFCVCFYGWAHAEKFTAAFCAAGFRIAGHLTFPKPYVSGKRYLAYQHESAYLLINGHPNLPEWAPSDVIEWTDYPRNELHLTQKPLSVLTPLLEAFSQKGQTVVDPFAGSGSTLIAARDLSHDFIGIELDPQYHAIAKQRLAKIDCEPIAGCQNTTKHARAFKTAP
jgi:site-specific DNA-methyltransferase (adenine-specific)